MRKLAFFAIVAVAAICTLSCSKEIAKNEVLPPSETVLEKCELTVGVKDVVKTKSLVGPSVTSKEDLISTLQVLVFRDGIIDGYVKAEAASATVSCTQGARTVYALVNAPDMSTVATLTELKAKTSLLSNCDFTNFEMIGSADVTLPLGETLDIPVERLVAKVYLKKITRNFTNSVLAGKTCTIKEIFLTNAAGDINYGLTATPTIWYNKMKYEAENSHMLLYDSISTSLDNQSSNSEGYCYYAYPNAAAEASEGGWSPRRTRLVVKAQIGNEEYYYPVTLPVMESNKSYVIEELTLTRTGSVSPDIPVSIKDATFTVSVVDWTVVPVVDGTTI